MVGTYQLPPDIIPRTDATQNQPKVIKCLTHVVLLGELWPPLCWLEFPFLTVVPI